MCLVLCNTTVLQHFKLLFMKTNQKPCQLVMLPQDVMRRCVSLQDALSPWQSDKLSGCSGTTCSESTSFHHAANAISSLLEEILFHIWTVSETRDW